MTGPSLKARIGLAHKVMGIVGFGNIGRQVGELANSFGMEVLAYNPRPKREPGFRPFGFVELDKLFSRADVISLHCPLTPENRGFVNAKLLDLMKSGSILINTARGPLVNQADLVQVLNSGRIGCAALDVADPEPLPDDSPLMTAKNIILTPHIAWASRNARRKLMRMTNETVRLFLRGRPLNVVNKRYLDN